MANRSAPAPSNVTARTIADDANPAASVARSVASQSAHSARNAGASRASNVSAARSHKSTVSARSGTEGDKVGQNLATTLLGAAAGAAIAYGWSRVDDEMWKKQSANAKSEAEEHFAKKERSIRGGKLERRRSASVEPARIVARSQTYPLVEAPPTRSRSLRSAKAPPSRSGRSYYRDLTAMDEPGSEHSRRSTRAIEALPSKSVGSQSAAQSSRAIGAGLPSRTSVKSGQSPTRTSSTTIKSAHTAKTARTWRDERAPAEIRSRRETALPQEPPLPVSKSKRSVTLPATSLAGVSSMVKGMHNAYERANQLYNEYQDMTASGIPLPGSRANSDSGGSRRGSAADVPLPASKAGSRLSRRSEYHSAAGAPLPASRMDNSVGARSHVSSTRDKGKQPAGTAIELPGSDREKILDDLETLAPDDSASQISSPPPSPPRMPHHSSHASRPRRHSDFRRSTDHRRDGYEYIVRPHTISETSESTIKPVKRHGRRDSGISLPVRPRRRISFGRGKGSAVHSAF